MIRVALLIDSPAVHDNRRFTEAAIAHAAQACDEQVDLVAIPTDALRDHRLEDYDGVFVGPGSPYRDPETVIDWIGATRERGVPLVGT